MEFIQRCCKKVKIFNEIQDFHCRKKFLFMHDVFYIQSEFIVAKIKNNALHFYVIKGGK